MINRKAQFISLEGSEGAGKSSAMDVITSTLASWNVPFITTREPGGEENAEHIRELLLHSDHLESKTELLLMFASRSEHVSKVIMPALLAGQWVVSDRYVDASYAYQGFGRGIDWSTIEFLEELIVGSFVPNLTVLLDVDPQIGLDRAANRSSKDRIEKENLAFFNNIRKGYHKRLALDPDRVKLIDANQPIALVKKDIQSELQSFKAQLNQ